MFKKLNTMKPRQYWYCHNPSVLYSNSNVHFKQNVLSDTRGFEDSTKIFHRATKLMSRRDSNGTTCNESRH